MFVHQSHITVPEEGLDTSKLFWFLQEAAAEHSTLLGYGEADMRALGVMWVVVRYFVQAERWPKGGETLCIHTWPGTVRHGFCPRFYVIRDAAGEKILTGSCLWAVVDRESRQMVIPHERGVDIEPLVTGEEARLPVTIRRPVTDRETSFTVPASYLDTNGHMNNTRYFDLAEQCAGVSARQRGLREVSVEYLNEALCGESMAVRWGMDGDRCTVIGEAADGHVFRMQMLYLPE